jgi:leader peptidase (prepilin peptidase)/N-methyltransferase
MTGLLAALCGVLGLAVGSFLNVVIWRVPRGESVVRPPSHCPGCDAPIAPRDNVPVASWLLLRGRCRHCSSCISVRYPAVELLTAILYVVLALRIGPHIALLGYLWLASVGVALAAIDLDLHRLPDVLTLPSYVVGITVFAVAVAVDGHTWSLVRAAIGMTALFAFYFAVVLAYPRGMGLGDVKLAGVLGLFLGWLGWDQLIVGAFLAFLIGGVVSIGLVLFNGAGRKTAVPFGPFMLTGALIGILAGGGIGSAYLTVLGR